jgi:hypothetical protein
MKDITIIMEDKLGLLADISYILGKARINIESISSTSVGGKAIISIVVKNAKKAQNVLEQNGFKVSSGNILFIRIPNTPGNLSKIAKMLVDGKINLEKLAQVSIDGQYVVIGLTVDRPRKARKVLAEYLVENINGNGAQRA